ncbi:HAD hydrolase-like protein [Candidatus Woesearchaeota archaeon]|nr:HAD hydrolase-like protein [Candidatus Woesearchaeota archaeon]
MNEHWQGGVQALKEHLLDYLNPENYKLTYRMRSVNNVLDVEGEYDLILLDRDCTLHGYRARKRDPRFERTLHSIKHKAEIVSNTSYEGFVGMRDVFGDLLPMSKLVRVGGLPRPCLLRYSEGQMKVLFYDAEQKQFEDLTAKLCDGDVLLEKINHHYKKPDPILFQTVVEKNKCDGRVPENPKVLMVGDRWLTDIVGANLAGLDTALVTPVSVFGEKVSLLAGRLLMDVPIGMFMNRL